MKSINSGCCGLDEVRPLSLRAALGTSTLQVSLITDIKGSHKDFTMFNSNNWLPTRKKYCLALFWLSFAYVLVHSHWFHKGCFVLLP